MYMFPRIQNVGVNTLIVRYIIIIIMSTDELFTPEMYFRDLIYGNNSTILCILSIVCNIISYIGTFLNIMFNRNNCNVQRIKNHPSN